ncbi:hypothetical protein EPN29_05335 [bacterium]|nr:MAG: hypothetical protein EPN29_05335 [bacterium]
MVSYTNGNGAQVQWAYNLRNLPTTITYPGNLNVSRGYDAAGRWTSVQDWNGNQTSFGYDANSNLTTETLPTASGVVDTSTFDNADRLSAIKVTKGLVPLFTANYTRDAANQLTSDSSASTGAGSYKYTPLNQLCYAGAANLTACSSPPPSSITYKYDAADNLTQTGSTQQVFNNADELCWTASTSGTCSTPPTGATTYQYDTRGNRTSVTPATGQAQTLTYDQANRLTKYAAASTTSYGYNADGLRMSKTATATTQFVWDMAAGLPLLLKDGTTAYVYGPGGLPLEQISGSATYYLHHDQLGSTRLVTDSSGTGQATYTFDPYGNLVASTGALTNPFRFAGQYLDPESDLYYLRARYYDPGTGQFMSRDPMVRITRQAYTYAGDTPLNGTDPAGLAWWNQAAAAVVGGVGAFVGNAVDNLHSSNPALVALGVAESVVIAAPIAGVIFVAGGGAAVAAGIEAVSGAIAATSEAAAVYGPLGGIYTARVLAQMSQDDYHGFPTLMDSMVNESDATAGVGADGQAYTYVNLPGFINGCSGTYQWVINGAGEITHRFFAPGT